MKRAAVFAGLVVGWLALLLAPAAPASAHAVLASSTPPANAILTTAPSEVVLTFSEAVRQVPDKIRVIAPDGSRADTGEPTFSGAVVSIAVDPLKPNGTYLVTYRVISADSHPVAGGYTYSVGAPSAPPSAAGGTADEETSRLLAVTIPIVKYVGYGGLVLLVGPTLVLALLWPQRLSRTAPTRLAYVGLGLVAFSTLIELWLQAPYTTGGGYFDGTALRDVLASQFGTTHLVRLAVLIAAAFLLRPVLSGRGGPADRALLAILAIVGLATWPLSGHAGASPVPSVSVVVDAAHLAGMAVWLGGLVMLVGFLLPQADERELGAILPVWSRWAALAVAGLLLAGAIQALIEVSTVSALFGTTYGRVIIAKVVLFSVVIAVAAYSRRLVRARVAASRPFPLRRAIWAELGITAVVLALSASLVQITPGAYGGGERDRRRGDDVLLVADHRRPLQPPGRRRPGGCRQQLGPPVRVHQGQPAAAGGRVAGDGGAAVGRHRADGDPPAAVDRQPRQRRDQPADRGAVGNAFHRTDFRHRPGNGDRHRAREVRGSLHDPSPGSRGRAGCRRHARRRLRLRRARLGARDRQPAGSHAGLVRAVRVPRAQRERRRVHRQARGEPAGRRAGGLGVDPAGARLDGGRRAGDAADADRGARHADHRGSSRRSPGRRPGAVA